jgi:hypothetical protein
MERKRAERVKNELVAPPGFGVGDRPLTPAEESEFTGMYAKVCNWFQYHDHPDYPRDGALKSDGDLRSPGTEGIARSKYGALAGRRRGA